MSCAARSNTASTRSRHPSQTAPSKSRPAAANRLRSAAATVLTPEHGDFNDDLAALGPQTLATRLAPLLGTGP